MKMADLEAIVALKGQGHGYDTSRDQLSHETYHDPLPIRAKIYAFVCNSPAEVSRGDIAKHLNLKKTGYLHGHIEALVEAGRLARANGQHTNGVLKYLYTVSRRVESS